MCGQLCVRHGLEFCLFSVLRTLCGYPGFEPPHPFLFEPSPPPLSLQLFAPVTDFYDKFAEVCIRDHVSVDMFVMPRGHMDLASVGQATKMTGGSLYHYHGYDPFFDREQVGRAPPPPLALACSPVSLVQHGGVCVRVRAHFLFGPHLFWVLIFEMPPLVSLFPTSFL